MISERDRIVAEGQQHPGLEGARRQGKRGDRQGNRQSQRRRDPRSGHGTRLLHATNFVSHSDAGKMPAGKIREMPARDPGPASGTAKTHAPSAD